MTTLPGEEGNTSHKGEQSSEHSTLGRLSHRVTIPAMSECIASIYQEEKIMESILMVNPIPGVAERCHLAVVTSVDNTNQETLNCRLINPSGEDITMPEGISIALLLGLLEGIAIKPMEGGLETSKDRQSKQVNSLSKEQNRSWTTDLTFFSTRKRQTS